jgi:hypothetical protein
MVGGGFPLGLSDPPWMRISLIVSGDFTRW